MDFPTFSRPCPIFPKKPKKISSNSSRYVVELRRCYHNWKKKWFFRRKKLLIFSFADLRNLRKWSHQNFYSLITTNNNMLFTKLYFVYCKLIQHCINSLVNPTCCPRHLHICETHHSTATPWFYGDKEVFTTTYH